MRLRRRLVTGEKTRDEGREVNNVFLNYLTVLHADKENPRYNRTGII